TWVHGPDVAFTSVRGWRTRVTRFLRGRVQDPFVVREEIAACGAAFAGGDHVWTRSVRVHDEDLIALQIVSRGLENDPFSIGRPVGFGVLTARRELLDMVQVRSL